ncbi:MAG: hypothetical protein MK180_02490 [Rhodobacteraceae bacterium]|nr:hypothetical protein [Paracoccaceae bacterium]
MKDVAGSRWFGPLLAAAAVAAALAALRAGAGWSFLEGPFGHASGTQNLILNLWLAAVLLAGGLWALLAVRQNPPRAVVTVSPGRIEAPGGTVEMQGLTRLQKLSVDGVWEFNIWAVKTRLRLLPASFVDPEDFERVVAAVSRHVPQCPLEVESRIDPRSLGA